MDNVYEINRETWNLKTKVNAKSTFYDVEGFKKGESSLKEIEGNEVGDVAGKSLIHLQCHFGLDTLSWARLGAEVTGVDISDEAITLATSLAKELNLKADFLRANVYDIPKMIETKYDIVFTSYGALNWLEDIDAWAGIVAGLLKPNGRFHMVEFHPFIFSLDENCQIDTSYFSNEGPVDITEAYTYADPDNKTPHRTIEWNHSLSEVVNALIRKGLRLEHLNEFPYLVYDCFPNLVPLGPGKWVYKASGPRIPHMYSIKAVKE